MKICTTCGTTNPEGVKICKNCGSPIKTVNSTTVVRTQYRRNRANKQKTKKSNDFNPVQHLHNTTPKQNSPLQSLNPNSEKLEYKFLSPGQHVQKLPLQSIPPTPVEELVIPQPVGIRKRKHYQATQKTYPKSESINLSENTISNNDLTAIPSQSLGDTVPQIQPVSVPPVKNPSQRKSVQSPSVSQPIMAFNSQSIQSQQIEQEMTNIMSTLKAVSPPPPSTMEKNTETDKSADLSIPNSLHDILINLTQLDVNIEASALVNLNGKILTSAISQRIDEFLLSTITNTLGTISQDVIASLESGDLKFISLYATKGILFLSPIMKNVYLVLYTSSDAKMGLINLARMIVKKKIELFYAKQNLKKSPV